VVPVRYTGTPSIANILSPSTSAKNVFPCFKADCAVQGNVLDFWAALHRLPLYDAALSLAATFHLPRNREEEPVK